MRAALLPIVHGIAVVLGMLGVQSPDQALAALGAATLVGALASVLAAAVRAVLARRPRLTAVGARARRHAILLGHLPDESHPDAPGHVRSRAPGRLIPAA